MVSQDKLYLCCWYKAVPICVASPWYRSAEKALRLFRWAQLLFGCLFDFDECQRGGSPSIVVWCFLHVESITKSLNGDTFSTNLLKSASLNVPVFIFCTPFAHLYSDDWTAVDKYLTALTPGVPDVIGMPDLASNRSIIWLYVRESNWLDPGNGFQIPGYLHFVMISRWIWFFSHLLPGRDINDVENVTNFHIKGDRFDFSCSYLSGAETKAIAHRFRGLYIHNNIKLKCFRCIYARGCLAVPI